MEDLKRKYANFMLARCVSINEGEPLIIDYSKEQLEFANILKEEAKKMGIREIYDLYHDYDKAFEILMNSSLEEIKNNPYFDRTILKDVYHAGGSLIMLYSYEKTGLDKVPKEKRDLIRKISLETQGDAIEARRKFKFPYTIVAISTKEWADKVFPNEENNLEKLWNIILDITLMKNDNPFNSWNEKIENNNKKRNYLNELKLKKLKYKNSLGTDLELELPDDVIWWGAGKKSFDGKKDLITNMPTEEVYTTPLKHGVNGVVYTSKPLVISETPINQLKLTFKDGKLIDVWASNDLEKVLYEVDSIEGMRYLGECALVDYNSPISNTNMIFNCTLIDENASCHLALGDGFPKTIPNGDNLSFEELKEKGINRCLAHTDFMIGTSDLSIIGTDIYGNDIPIFVDGNFAMEKVKSFLKERKDK